MVIFIKILAIRNSIVLIRSDSSDFRVIYWWLWGGFYRQQSVPRPLINIGAPWTRFSDKGVWMSTYPPVTLSQRTSQVIERILANVILSYRNLALMRLSWDPGNDDPSNASRWRWLGIVPYGHVWAICLATATNINWLNNWLKSN